MAIKISLVSDVADALRGANQVADSFEGVQDALDDVAREARKTGDAVGEIKDGTQDAERASDDMERKFRGDFDKVRKDAKDAGDAIGREVKDGTDRAGEGMDEFKDEAGGTAREAAASFDGSADSIAEVFQELSANAFAGFGPAGAAAGVAAAVGLGLAISKLQEIADKTNEAKEQGAEWAQSFNSVGVQERLTAARDRLAELSGEIQDSREWWELWQDDAVTSLEAVNEGLRVAGRDATEFGDAMANTDPQGRADDLAKLAESLRETADGYDASNLAAANRFDLDEARMWGEKRDAVEGAAEAIEKEASAQEAANEVERISAETMGVSIDQYRTYNELSDEAKGRIDEVAEGQKGLAVETEAANAQISEQNELTRDLIGTELDWLDTLDGLSAQVEKNGDSLSKNTSKGRENIRYILDAVDSIDDLYESTLAETGSQERAESARSKATRELISQAEAAGYDERQIKELIDRINRMPSSKTTDIKADTSPARKSLRDFVDLDPGDIWTGVRVDTARGAQDVASFRHTQQSIPVTIALRAV